MIGALIVERAREKPGRRRLADPADAGQHEGMRDPARLEGVTQRSHHGFLADQVGEELRAVLPREHLIGRLGLGRAHFLLSKHGEGRIIALAFGLVQGLITHRAR